MDFPATDPTPYIASAYALGFVGIFGYMVWLIRERKRILQFISVLENEGKDSHHAS